MKILYHHRTRSKDGQTVHIEELIAALRRQGHEVIVAAPPAMETAAFGSDAGTVALMKRLLPAAFYELLELGYSLVAFRRLRQAYLRHRPDVLYERYNLFLLAGLWLNRLYGIPLLLEVNAPLFQERQEFGNLRLRRLARWAERAVWRSADFVLPVTGVLAETVKGAGVAAERTRVIPNGVGPEFLPARIDGEPVRGRLGLQGRLILGFTGFVRPWHGMDRVIDFIADSDPGRGLHLLLIGDGPALPDLRRQAAERGVSDRVTFTGIVDRHDIAGYIAAFDIALQPHVVPYASPLKLFEYMGLGRAIVAPAMPNILEVLQDGRNALLFDVEQPGGFRAAIERLCEDADLRRRLGAAAREEVIARGLTWDRNAERVTELAGRLVGAGPVTLLPASIGETP